MGSKRSHVNPISKAKKVKILSLRVFSGIQCNLAAILDICWENGSKGRNPVININFCFLSVYFVVFYVVILFCKCVQLLTSLLGAWAERILGITLDTVYYLSFAYPENLQ